MSNSPIIYGGTNELGKTLLPPSSSGASTVDTDGNIGNINIGGALGLATLDASAKIPSSQLPSTLLEYQGQWNPVTNTPTLQDSTGVNANVYVVSTAFSGPIVGLSNATMVNFQVGNLVIFSSSLGQWEQTTPAAGVSSVNGAQGAVTVNAINQLTGDVTAGPASGSSSQVASLVATSNSTLTTLSALSLPGSQVTGNISGNAANITATSNSTLTTLSALSLPGAQVTGNIPGNAANITATSNSTLTTLSALSLPGAQVTGNISGNAANITATSNSTLTTLSALSLPYSQVTGTPTPFTFSDSLVKVGTNVTLVNDTASPSASQYYGTNGSSVLGYYNLPSPGSGTVTTVSVVSANGLAGTVANPTTTPALTLSTTVTGVLKGDGTAISAATAGTDYVIPSGSITGTATNITATSNSTLTTLSALSLPGSQVTGNISGNAANVTGTVAVANGGTGQTSYTDGQLLIGNSSGNTLTKSTLTAGSNVTVTNGNGSITVAVPSLVTAFNYTAQTTTYSASVSDYVLASGASFTITLPTAVGQAGKGICIQHNGTSLTQLYTLNTTSSQTIGGVASGSYALYTNGEFLQLISDGSNWQILSHKTDTSWTSYIPTFVGNGTPTNVSCWWRRSGDTMFLRLGFTNGTVTASTASVTLPGSLNFDTSKLSTTSNNFLGTGATTSASSATITIIAGTSNANTLNFGIAAAGNGGLTAAGGTTVWATSEVLSYITTSIPIVGFQP